MDLKGKDEGRNPVSLEASMNQESVPPDPENLCEFCNSIDFGAVGFYNSGFHRDKMFNELRPLCKVLQSTDCFFCTKIAKFCDEWSRLKVFDKQAPKLQDERNDAEYVMGPIVRKVDEVDEPGGPDLVRLRVDLVIRKPSPECGAYGPSLQFQKCSHHPPKVEDYCNGRSLLDWESGEEQAYGGRIRPLLADTRLFSKWKETCCTIHGDNCNSIFTSGRRYSPRLRLIDVKKRCIVDSILDVDNRYVVGSEVGISYTALSYVWGKDKFVQLRKNNEEEFRQAGSLTRQRVPSTIDDALEVTERLGENYIWVDSLCIIQDDEADKLEYLPKMDSIFGCASVTIVAASGDDANAGLPGIRPNSRTNKQIPFTIKGVSLLQTLDSEGSGNEFTYLGEYMWYRRGWTFQEKIFSKRALIFTKEQVYWECQKATWCEDGLWETTESPPVYRHSFAEKDFRHPWSSELSSFERIYRKVVEEYSRRMLTYEKDGLDAFAGILNAFETGAGQTFLWALPTSFLSSALTWRCDITQRREKCTASVKKKEGSSDGTITQCPFPSWSWVGWVGGICFASSHGRLNAETVDLIFFYLNGSGSLRQVEAIGATQSLSQIHVREDVDETIVTHADISESILARSLASNILFFWSSTAKLHVQHGVLSCNGKVVPTEFWFHTPGPEEQGEFEFVVIGKFTEYRDPEKTKHSLTREDIERNERLLAVLLVLREDGVAYRKGLVHIDSWDWVALGNREWKLICLG